MAGLFDQNAPKWYTSYDQVHVIVPEPEETALQPSDNALYGSDHLEPQYVVRKRVRNPYRLNQYERGLYGDKVSYVFQKRFPNMQRVIDETEDRMGRLIYRAYSDKSAGKNGPDGFLSHAAFAGQGTQDLGFMTEDEVKDNITGHINCRKGDFRSHFISFTDDFDWVVQHAYQMYDAGEKNVHIAVIDTHSLKPETIIFKAFPLLRAHNVEHYWTKRMTYIEYVAWDQVNLECSVTEFGKMLHLKRSNSAETIGLRELIPDMVSSKANLKSKVGQRRAKDKPTKPYVARNNRHHKYERNRLRVEIDTVSQPGRRNPKPYAGAYWRTPNCDHSIHQETRMSVDATWLSDYVYFCVACFEESIRFPMIVNLLGMRSGYAWTDDIVDALAEYLDGNYPYASEIHHVNVV